MSWVALVSVGGAVVSVVVAYLLHRKPQQAVVQNTVVPPSNGNNQQNNMSITLPQQMPREGVVVLPTRSFMNMTSGKEAPPSEADDVGGEAYRVHVERHYTVKVPITVDVHKPSVWTSHQDTEDFTVNKQGQ
jgi:Co/Zn/Cd efflux system component